MSLSTEIRDLAADEWGIEMNAVYSTGKQDRNSPHRTDGAARKDGAPGPEPREEFYGYPFICGFYMGTDENTDGRS